MENDDNSDKTPIPFENVRSTESAEDFQKFIHDLFEKNGILNDLRSYLRGHIVNVLKGAQTGSVPACQKNFIQRLESKYQALNVLIAEYLINMEFTYTFSVFISEMPLANMAFSFAKSLLKNPEEYITKLRFDDKDVWAVLNNLGIECDAECASTILDSYRNEDVSLLSCILKCAKLHRMDSSADSQSESSMKSSDSPSDRKRTKNMRRCYHVTSCQACKTKFAKLKKRYREKIKRFEENKAQSFDGVDLKKLMKDISLVETNLIDEMFQQIKSVYETEIEMMKSNEQRRVREAVHAHALHLKQKATELEKSYREREASLEASIRQKKQFLFDLAQNLKKEHKRIKSEAKRLTDKEENLKQQLIESEEILRKRGEEMKTQITSELAILEKHLQTMKGEKDGIAKERIELENLRSESGSKCLLMSKAQNQDYSNYDLLKNEVVTLKNFIQSKMSEQSTVKDVLHLNSNTNVIWNNEAPRHLLNDLRKKDVNFCSVNTDISTKGQSSTFVPDQEIKLRELREENDRLKALADQQREEINALSSQRRMQAVRPRTAPAITSRLHPFQITVQSRLTTSPITITPTHNGAGEELNMFAVQRPRVLLPSDAIPFIGPIAVEGRRHLINQWRTLRRLSPPRGVKRSQSPAHRKQKERKDIHVVDDKKLDNPSTSQQNPEEINHDNLNWSENIQNQNVNNVTPKLVRSQHSQTTVKTSKEKTRSKPSPSPNKREKSPTAVLREAKLRLRKLEIEAEAVDRSYREYRNRRTNEWQQGCSIENKPSRSSTNISKSNVKSLAKETQDCISEFDKFLKEYPVRINRTKPQTENIVRPIPNAYTDGTSTHEKVNYLETPLDEFRKFYNSQNEPKSVYTDNVFTPLQDCESISEKDESKTNVHDNSEVSADKEEKGNKVAKEIDTKNVKIEEEERNDLAKEVKTKQEEYVILVENVNKLYNVTKTDSIDTQNTNNEDLDGKVENISVIEDNLIIEVENVKAGSIQVNGSSENLLIDIESSLATQEIEIHATKPDEFENEVRKVTVANENNDKDNIEIQELYQITSKNEFQSVESASNKEDYDYPEDFSPEVESDESITNGIPSPISLGQTINDESFWD